MAVFTAIQGVMIYQLCMMYHRQSIRLTHLRNLHTKHIDEAKQLHIGGRKHLSRQHVIRASYIKSTIPTSILMA